MKDQRYQVYYEVINEQERIDREVFLPIWKQFKNDLNQGRVRVATKEENGEWIVNKWVKQFILLGFKFGEVCQFNNGSIDKDTFGERQVKLKEKVRIVSPTVSIRDGVHIASGVTFMPPSYANIGAYIDEGTMVDSLVLVGSCAQIGRKVHIGAGTIIDQLLNVNS